MRLRKTLIACSVLAVLIGAGMNHAHADGFANITGGVFSFDSTKGFSSGATFGGSTATVFDFTINTEFYNVAAGTPIPAIITLSGTLDGSAIGTSVFGGQQIVYQGLKNVTETVTATSGAHTNLLSVSGATGAINGIGNSATFSLSGSNIFSSDYFSPSHLAGVQSQSILLTTDSSLMVSGSTMSSGPVTQTTGALGNFTGVAQSDIFRSSSVPEASTLLGLGGLIVGGGLLGLRRRKA